MDKFLHDKLSPNSNKKVFASTCFKILAVLPKFNILSQEYLEALKTWLNIEKFLADWVARKFSRKSRN